MNGTEIVKYFNTVLLSKKDDKFFSVCQCSVPKHLKCETVTEKKYFNNLSEQVADFSTRKIIFINCITGSIYNTFSFTKLEYG